MKSVKSKGIIMPRLLNSKLLSTMCCESTRHHDYTRIYIHHQEHKMENHCFVSLSFLSVVKTVLMACSNFCCFISDDDPEMTLVSFADAFSKDVSG